MSEESVTIEDKVSQSPVTLYDELKAIAQANDHEEEASPSSVDVEQISNDLKRIAAEDVPTDELVNILVKASAANLTAELEQALQKLRTRRQAGNSQYRINDDYTYSLDLAVVKLLRNSHEDIAQGLLSSSDEESRHFQWVIERLEASPEEKSDLKLKLDELCKKNQRILRQNLQKNGVSEPIVELIISRSAAPDSAAAIPAEFWHDSEQDASLIELLEMGGSDFAKSAAALDAIKKAELQEYGKILLRKVISLDSGDESDTYLRSFAKAASSLQERKGTQGVYASDMRSIAEELATFEDPFEALISVNRLYGQNDPKYGLLSLRRLLNAQYKKDLIKFRKEDIVALALLRDYCSVMGISDDFIQYVSEKLSSVSNPEDHAKNIVEGLRLADVKADSNIALFSTIAKAENPIMSGRAVSIIEASLTELDIRDRQDIQNRILNSQNPEVAAVALTRAVEEINKHGLSIEDIGARGLFEVMNQDEDTIERYCSDWKIKRQAEISYQEYLRPVRESGDLTSIDSAPKPNLADLPELRDRLDRLGLPLELAESLLGAWTSYSSLRRKLYDDGQVRTNVTAEDIDSALGEQGERILNQLMALSTYVDRFGADEAIEIINTFGIHNFIRYKPEVLHDQLVNWVSGQSITKNVIVAARADWNGAVDDVGYSFQKLFGDDGLFFFEANDSRELAKLSVAVGNRERAKGRTPEEFSGVENFVIDAHANANGIRLGTDGQQIKTDDFLTDSLSAQKPNTYQRHLGKRFRLILKACSTAGEVGYGKNIAESIADHHDVRVEASKEITSGSIIIDPDGSVRFNGGDVPSTVYI